MKQVTLILAVLAAMLAPAPVSAQSHWPDVDRLIRRNLELVRRHADPRRSGPRYYPWYGWDNYGYYDDYGYGYDGYDYGRRRYSFGRSLGERALNVAENIATYEYIRARERPRYREVPQPESQSEPDFRRTSEYLPETEVRQGTTPFVRNSTGVQIQIRCQDQVVDMAGLPEIGRAHV